jgi:hypothetical protein
MNRRSKNKKMNETTQSEMEDGVLIGLAAKGNSDAVREIVVRIVDRMEVR